jgi:hypothetical protein
MVATTFDNQLVRTTAQELTKRRFPCVCENFPDPLDTFRRDRWIPFIPNASVEKNMLLLITRYFGGTRFPDPQAALRYTRVCIPADRLSSRIPGDLRSLGGTSEN